METINATPLATATGTANPVKASPPPVQPAVQAPVQAPFQPAVQPAAAEDLPWLDDDIDPIPMAAGAMRAQPVPWSIVAMTVATAICIVFGAHGGTSQSHELPQVETSSYSR